MKAKLHFFFLLFDFRFDFFLFFLLLFLIFFCLLVCYRFPEVVMVPPPSLVAVARVVTTLPMVTHKGMVDAPRLLW